MAAGCVVIGSETGPVQEVIDGSKGLLVPFFDPDALAQTVIAVLGKLRDYDRLRSRARETILNEFDLKTQCLPKLLGFLGAPRFGIIVGEGSPTTWAAPL